MKLGITPASAEKEAADHQRKFHCGCAIFRLGQAAHELRTKLFGKARINGPWVE